MNLTRSLILTLSLLGFTAAHAAPPANDSILKAIKLSGNYSIQLAQNLSLATADPMDPLVNGASAGKTLWYALPYYPVIGTLNVTVTSTTAVGTFSVFEAQDPDNPRGSLYRVKAPIPLAAGQTATLSSSYSGKPLYVMLAGMGSCSVTHRISNASYDFPSDAYTLNDNFGTVSLNNTTASNTADEPVLPTGAAAMSNIVWCKWTPSFTGFAYFDTNFSYSGGDPQFSLNAPHVLHDTQIAIYGSTSGGTADALTPFVANNDSGYGGKNSRLAYLVISGSTYYIAVGTVSGSPGDINLQYYRSGTPSEIYFHTNDLGASSEGAETHPVIVRRRYATTGTATCTLATSNGDATAGSDYTSLSTTVTFSDPSGGSSSSWQVNVLVTLLQDSLDESKYEGVNVTLSASSPGSTISADGNPAHFYIWDDESGGNSSIVLSGDYFRVGENQGSFAIQVNRGYLVDTSYLELFQTAMSGNALITQDFTFSNGVLPASGSSSMIHFSPANDNVFEGDETVEVSVAGQATYYVVIEDDDLYIPVPGKLTTSLTYAAGVRSAVLYSTVSAVGAVSGKLILPGQTLPFTGKLDTRGKLQVALQPKGRSLLYLKLAAQDSAGHMTVELLDTSTNGLSSANALIQNFRPVVNPCPLAGSYTVAMEAMINDGLTIVANAGAASCKVSVSGNAVFVGKLFDGTAHTVAGFVDGEGTVGAIAPAYAGIGFVGYSGPLPLVSGSQSGLTVSFGRPARADDPLKFGAYAGSFSGICARYTPPAPGARVLEAWNSGTGKATLIGGPLATTLTKALAISTANLITAPADAEKLKLAVVPATGMFSGSFVLPGTTKTLSIYGSLRDLPGLNGSGIGYFFDGRKGGVIYVGQP